MDKTRPLPPPRTDSGTPLMRALEKRASARRFAATPLPDPVLADLLWAAVGVNRPDSGRRTAPSACNWQEIDLYAVLPDGAWLYQPRGHRLEAVREGDLRPFCGVQDFVAQAPLVLVYAADLAKMKGADDYGQCFYPACDSGFACANASLYCAAAGLATVALVSVDKPALHAKLGLRPDQVVTLTQPVGYPA